MQLKPLLPKYHRLTVVERISASIALCSCECGSGIREYETRLLRSGKTKSCGCYAKEVWKKDGIRRGFQPKPSILPKEQRKELAGIWSQMKARCTKKYSSSYAKYGARGISVCERWLDFENFASDMGARPSKKHSIDRIDGERGYEPGNCKWATSTEQNRNRSNTVWFEIAGQTRTLAELCEHHEVPRDRVISRLRYGWPIELALTAPLRFVFNAHSRTSRDGANDFQQVQSVRMDAQIRRV